jgi:hypothetical protein
VSLNAGCYWKNVPRPVWELTLGGYQVLKKWLSYREFALLGRSLTADEALEFTWMARRLAALIGLRPALDGNYRACLGECVRWPIPYKAPDVDRAPTATGRIDDALAPEKT